MLCQLLGIVLLTQLLCARASDDPRVNDLLERVTFPHREKLLARAQRGDVDAMADLGWWYITSRLIGCADYDEARRWFEQARSLGSPRGTELLGVMYFKGFGVKQNYGKAYDLYLEAVAKGYGWAADAIGTMYRQGAGKTKDDAEAERWSDRSIEMLRAAAATGDADAMHDLGFKCMYGRTTQRSPNEGVQWYRKAAEHGSAKAIYAIGLLHRDGKWVEHDLQKALRHYRDAAAMGHQTAMFTLGGCYEHGIGVQVDYGKAIAWYRLGESGYDRIAHILLNTAYRSEDSEDYCFAALAKLHEIGRLRERGASDAQIEGVENEYAILLKQADALALKRRERHGRD